MSAQLLRTLSTLGPWADGAANTPELRFDSGVVSSVNPLPVAFNGKWVEVTNESVVAGDYVAVLFSKDPAQVVTLGAPAANGGAALNRGRLIMPGQTRRMRVPCNQDTNKVVQFARIAAANTPAISISMVE